MTCCWLTTCTMCLVCIDRLCPLQACCRLCPLQACCPSPWARCTRSSPPTPTSWTMWWSSTPRLSPQHCLVRHSVCLLCAPDQTAAHPALRGLTGPCWEPAASRPGDPAISCPCLLDPFDVMPHATARRQPAVPGRLSSLLSPLQLAEHHSACHDNPASSLFVMLWELGAAGKHIVARCVAGFPESKRAVLTASLKHSFEAVGGSAVQITFEDTEVGPAHLCSPPCCACCPLSLHCRPRLPVCALSALPSQLGCTADTPCAQLAAWKHSACSTSAMVPLVLSALPACAYYCCR